MVPPLTVFDCFNVHVFGLEFVLNDLSCFFDDVSAFNVSAFMNVFSTTFPTITRWTYSVGQKKLRTGFFAAISGKRHANDLNWGSQ